MDATDEESVIESSEDVEEDAWEDPEDDDEDGGVKENNDDEDNNKNNNVFSRDSIPKLTASLTGECTGMFSYFKVTCDLIL